MVKGEGRWVMRLSTAQALLAAADALGVEGVALLEGYSGRGMYGRQTVALTANRVMDLMPLVAQATLELSGGTQGGRPLPEALAPFLEDVSDLAHDSMGRGVVVW